MFAKVSSQLVGTGKLPPTTLPTALVWLLAGVRPQMSLQVGTLRVCLRAAIVVAHVLGYLLGPTSLTLSSCFGGSR